MWAGASRTAGATCRAKRVASQRARSSPTPGECWEDTSPSAPLRNSTGGDPGSASERARSSVVPVQFWWLSLVGGLMLLTYFLRRGDPVGVAGQLFGVVVYSRNLLFIARDGDAKKSSG